MIRILVQVLGASVLAVALMFPGFDSDYLFASDHSRPTSHERVVPASGMDLAERYVPEDVTASGNEQSTPSRSRDGSGCAQVSRLCDRNPDWNPLKTDRATGEEAGPIVPESADEDAGTTANGQQNRSVVGWQSASISSLQNEEYPEPESLKVPSLSISADVAGVGIDPDRAMNVPDDVNTVGWYQHGPSPGQDGSSVIAGHLDDYNGRSVFYDLQHIELDASIIIGFEDGSQQEFRVSNKDSYDAGDLPSDRLFRRDGVPVLSLITCGGTWDSSQGRYSETVVVYAVPV